MLLAERNNIRIEAEPGIYDAICPHCKRSVIPVCGSYVKKHWRHKANECDYPDKEPETPWHLDWKSRALKLGLEVEKLFSFNGEFRKADIYDPNTNTVTELQHSPISSNIILDRCIFYSKNRIHIQWIFDMTEKFIQGNLEIPEYFQNYPIFGVKGYSICEIQEKYKNKALNCLFDKDASPRYGVSMHYKYNEYNDPMLVRILSRHIRGRDSGIIHKFQNFREEGILMILDMLKPPKTTEVENTIEELEQSEKRYFQRVFGD